MKEKTIYTWIGGLILTVTGGLLVEFFKGYPITERIWSIILWIWTYLIKFINIRIQLYWVIIIIASILLLLWLIASVEIKKEESQSKSSLFNFTEASYYGILWKFSWELTNNGWTLKNLRPCCPIDKTPLINYSCPRCRRSYYDIEMSSDSPCEDKVQILIIEDANKLLQNEQGLSR